MSTKKHITELHTEINEWKSKVNFVKDELKTFQDQLASVSAQNTAQEIKMKVGHFESIFIRQDEVNDELSHELQITDNNLGDKVKGNPAGDRVLFDDLVELRDKIAVFEKIWSENKTDFRRFLSESL
ncbi:MULTISPECIES: hypothetical protein [Flectobacillus]|jgi:chromosome segregation ATPase|uniref:hypothetical protein n=1 Tax=Flectobacillus TaxID=101 RepID=UPI000BA3AA6A|nr:MULTISPECIES: hypothetical protein [Flectobacillus]MDI9868852.1 hypothetical protein [Flectobacillus roseus]NBA74196.1 hypothetical protein [Emticicia sp. ODNR4P]PAC30737.1 hypothetical protein BWI92_12010 [Flectobacillus sp. BAB-3569]